MGVIAGVLDPGGPDREAVRAALAEHGAPAVEVRGPLAVGAAGGAELDVGVARDGAFAVVTFDDRRGRGVLARDRMGERSVYMADDGRRLLFATDLGVLLRLMPRRPEPDPASVASWLATATVPGTRTLFAGIRRLAPGETLRLEDRAIVRHPPERPAPRSPAEVRTVLEAAVARELGKDVRRAGVLLSGGLDSATVAALAARRLGPTAVAGYSVTFPGLAEVDEGTLIVALARELGIASTRLEVEGGSLIAGALAYAEAWQAPLISPNHAVWSRLREHAQNDGIDVLLDGEGGDELFSAQPYLIADRVAHGRVASALALGRALAGDRADRDPIARRALLQFGVRGALPAGLHERARRARGAARHATPWLRPDASAALFAAERPWDWKRQDGPRWRAALRHALIDGRDALGVHEHLRRAAVGGPPTRHPLLDEELADLALGLDPALAFEGPSDRPVLRAALAGLVPDDVRLRPRKSYFDAFHARAFRTDDRPAIDLLLGDPAAEVYAFADRDAVAREFLAPLADPAARTAPGWSATLWRLAAVECWLRAEADPTFPRRALETWDLPPLRTRLTQTSA